MAREAKVRSLQVRPVRSVDLALNVPGIVASRAADLGARVSATNLQTVVYSQLKTMGANGKLEFDGPKIRATVANNVLASLRNEVLEAELEQAIRQRQNAFLEWFEHSSDIIADLNVVHAPATDPNGKLARLMQLQRDSQARMDALDAAYTGGHGGVVKEVRSELSNNGTSNSTTTIAGVGMKSEAYQIDITGSQGNQTHKINEHQTKPIRWNQGTWEEVTEGTPAFANQKADGASTLRQETKTTYQEFRHPKLENRMRYQRTQLELQDQIMASQSFRHRLPHLATMFDNDLEGIDLEVRKAQLAFADTLLTSPVSGVVTAVYKDPGEAVQAGEAVLRVEDDGEILLVGILNFRGRLRLGDMIEVTTTDMYESGQTEILNGRVVAIRGHESDNDEWDVIIQCDNTIQLPLNYHFDRDNTKVEVL